MHSTEKEVTHPWDLMVFLSRLAKLRCFKTLLLANSTLPSPKHPRHQWKAIRTIEMFSNQIKLSKMPVIKFLTSKRISIIEVTNLINNKTSSIASIRIRWQTSTWEACLIFTKLQTSLTITIILTSSHNKIQWVNLLYSLDSQMNRSRKSLQECMHQKQKIEMRLQTLIKRSCKILTTFQFRKYKRCMVTRLATTCSIKNPKINKMRSFMQIRSLMITILMPQSLQLKESTILNGRFVMKLSKKSTNYSTTSMQNLTKAKTTLKLKMVINLYYTALRSMVHYFSK